MNREKRFAGAFISRRPWRALWCLPAMMLASLAFGAASGRVSGTVHDPSGAVIPGATVTLRNVATGTALKTSTDASGFYNFSFVAPATYTLSATSKGFKTYIRTGIVVTPGAVLSEDVTLVVGAMVQTVQVKASAVNLIPTSTGSETRTIGESEIQNLSTIGRNAMELLTLLPGVVSGTGIPGVPGGFTPTTGSSFDQGVGSFNVNGLRNDQNMLRLDNADIIDPGSNGGFIIEPNMDMIKEFSVKQSSFQASQGQSGLIIEAVSKSGGSHVHGEGYWYVRNSIFNANDWSNNQAGLPKPNSKFNYPGFNIGGPVRIPGTDFNKRNNKMFFFVGVEWQRQLADPGTELAVVPTAEQEAGNFSQLLNTKFCTTNSSGQVTGGRYLNQPCILKNPTTGAWGGEPALPGNIIPQSLMTQNGLALLKGNFPEVPNYVDPTGNYNFAGRPIYPENRSEETIRIDYNLSQNTRAFLRLAHNQEHHYYPYGLWSGENSGWTSNIPEPSPTLGIDSGSSATLNAVTVINPTLTNEVEFSTSGLWLPNHYANPSKLSSSALGFNFSGYNWLAGYGSNAVSRTNALPQITDNYVYSPTSGEPAAGRWGEGDIYSGVFANKTLFELRDNVTKVAGTHTFQFGTTIDRTRNDQNGDGFSGIPEGGIVTAPWDEFTTGNEFGDLLTQNFAQWGQATADPVGLWRFWNFEWYAQDSWKATRRLTLNYGARFAYMPPWSEARGNVSTFDPRLWTAANNSSVLDGIITASGGKAMASSPYIPPPFRGQIVTGLPNGVFPNPGIFVQPRLGFAYDVFGNGRTVLRGGGGIYVTRDQGNIAFFGADNVPFVFSSTSSGPSGGGFQGLGSISTINPYGALGNLALTADNMFDSQDPQTYEWSLTLDQDIGFKTVLDIAYVANESAHLTNEMNINAVPLGAMWAPGTETLDTTNAQPLRHYQPFGDVSFVQHTQTANYNSLQVTARRNVSRGLTLLASYTWSKTLGYATAFNNSIDPFNSRLDYGLLGYDRPQNLSISYIYQLPSLGRKYFRGNRFAGGVLDNWQISGITNFQSGAPMRVGISSIGCAPSSNPLCGSGNFTGSNETWYGTPDRAMAPLLTFNPQYGANFHGVNSDWFNPGSVSLPNINQPGTYVQPQFLGPGSNNWDMTLFKSFSLGEDRRLEFRWAAFDVFNRAQLDNPQTGATFVWQLPPNATSLTQGHAILTNPNTFGYILDKHGHREMEFAIKLFF